MKYKVKIHNPIYGVPITFLDKYNPEQFEIITMSTMSGKSANYWSMLNGKPKYSRVFICKKRKVLKLSDLIKEYQNKLTQNPHDYSCLLFALQIPSICSRLEIPKTIENTGKLYTENGRPKDKKLYETWIKNHSGSFTDIYDTSMTIESFSNNLYDLRCQMTHEGILMSNENHFYFTESCYEAMSTGSVIFFPMERLCKNMYSTALASIKDNYCDIEITFFNNTFLPSKIYDNILKDVQKTYQTFWDSHCRNDNTLNCIYDHIILNDSDMKKKIDEFFEENPDGLFEIWDFSSKYGSIIDVQETFIHKEMNKSKSEICLSSNKATDVLRLTRNDYNKMLQVSRELKIYSSEHPINVKKYSIGENRYGIN